MLTKILIFLAVLVGVFVVARMGASSAFRPVGRKKDAARMTGKRGKRGAQGGPAEDLVPCPVCGAFSARGDQCPCGQAPTP